MNEKTGSAPKPATQKPKQNKKKKRNKPRNKILVALIGVLAVGALTVTVVCTYVFGSIIAFTNGDLAINLDEYKENLNQTSFMYAYDKDGKEVEIARLHGEENRVWLDIDDMPDCMLKTCVALEDKRFNEHKGVDWIRTINCIISFDFDQGGSTLTQQLIKNLTQDKDVTVVRKFNEIMNALNLEKNYDKNAILEAYLNTVYLGSGCYGVETAAEKYFGKDVIDLNLAECATLLSITNAPTKYNPLINPDKNRVRQVYCLDQMLSQGVITKAEYDEAYNYELIFTTSDNYVPSAEKLAEEEAKKQAEEDEEFQSFYVDYVIQCVQEDLMEEYGYSKQQAMYEINYGGLKIYSAVDLDVQEQLEDVYENRITFPDEEDTEENPAVQSAMTIMDYSGRVVAIIGEAGEKSGNRCLNRAANSYRQPGSTIKPLATYAPAIDLKQLTWSTMTLDKAFPVNGSMWPHNVDHTLGSGQYVTSQYAVQKSLNTVPARVINNVIGKENSFAYLRDRFHLSRLDDTEDMQLAPLATGALHNGVSTVEMASAYATFGNSGVYYKPFSYYKVTNNKGTEIILQNDSQGEQVIGADTSDVMCELLQTVDTSYYGKGSNVRKFQIMAKTGTTSDDKDRWFCAGTPYYVCAIWYGYDQPKALNVSVNPAGKIFIEVFDRIHEDLPEKEFPKSSSCVKKAFCTHTGNLAGEGCDSTAYGWYRMGSFPPTCTTCTASSTPSEPGEIVSDIVDEFSSEFDDILDSILGEQ